MRGLSDDGSAPPVIAFIPARAGSKGLPGKNLRSLNGRPLYRHALETARAVGIERIVISTDIPELLCLNEQGVEIARRPEALAGDEATMGEVLGHFVRDCLGESTTIVLLQPTSPLRLPEDVRRALDLYRRERRRAVMSVVETSRAPLKYGFVEDGRFISVNRPEYCFANRQRLPRLYRPNGAVYVLDSEQFRHGDHFSNEAPGAIVMSEENSRDIDTLEDFLACEDVLRRREGRA